MSFPFLSFLFLSFNLLSIPFISNSNQDFLGFFWKSHYLGPTLHQGGVINKRPTLYSIWLRRVTLQQQIFPKETASFRAKAQNAESLMQMQCGPQAGEEAPCGHGIYVLQKLLQRWLDVG